jgi:hypothetical protein
MAQSLTDNATKANARPAGAAAIVVAGVMILQAILQAVIGIFSALAFGAADGGDGYFEVQNAFAPVAGAFQSLGTSVLPIAIGVFLAFWLVVPLNPELRVMQVVLRSLLASAIASAVSLVITIVFSFGGALVSSGPLFGNRFPNPDGSFLLYSVLGGIQSVFYTLVAVTPLVILAGLLAWLWVSKGRPAASAL